MTSTTNQANIPVERPPIVAQPPRNSVPGRIGFRRSFLCSFAGVLRLALIIFQCAGWIAAACIPKWINGSTYMPPEFSSTRDAYLFFSIVGFVLAIFFFFVYLFNFIETTPLKNLPIELIVIATDIIWVIPTFILAIVCAVREGSVSDPFFLNKSFINKGAFAAASFFGFVCAFIYGIDASFYLIKVVKAVK